jgi:hypothetical protein
MNLRNGDPLKSDLFGFFTHLSIVPALQYPMDYGQIDYLYNLSGLSPEAD